MTSPGRVAPAALAESATTGGPTDRHHAESGGRSRAVVGPYHSTPLSAIPHGPSGSRVSAVFRRGVHAVRQATTIRPTNNLDIPGPLKSQLRLTFTAGPRSA